jgi:hypothetical protein
MTAGRTWRRNGHRSSRLTSVSPICGSDGVRGKERGPSSSWMSCCCLRALLGRVESLASSGRPSQPRPSPPWPSLLSTPLAVMADSLASVADQLAGTSLNPEEPTSSLPLPGDRRHWSFATEWCDRTHPPSPPFSPGGRLRRGRCASRRLTSRPWFVLLYSATVENPSIALKDQHGSSSVPIYQTATFKGMDGAFDYTRSGNPTRSFLGTPRARTRLHVPAKGDSMPDNHPVMLQSTTSRRSRARPPRTSLTRA